MTVSALRALLLGAAALTLLACSQPSANTAAGANTASAPGAPSASGASTPAAATADAGGSATVPASQMGQVIPASQLPHPRAGLWETTETEAGHPPRQDRDCQSGRARDLDMSDSCQSVNIHRTLTGGYVIAASCAGNGMDMRMNMHAEGDFQNNYTLDTEVSMTRAGQTTTNRSHRVAHYAGPCPAGMEAED